MVSFQCFNELHKGNQIHEIQNEVNKLEGARQIRFGGCSLSCIVPQRLRGAGGLE